MSTRGKNRPGSKRSTVDLATHRRSLRIHYAPRNMRTTNDGHRLLTGRRTARAAQDQEPRWVEAAARQRGRRLKFIIGAIVLATIHMASPALAGDFPVSGQTSTVNSAGNGFRCFNGPASFDAYWGSKASGDTYGTADAKQHALVLRPGWRERMFGSDSGGKHSEVRIESGPKAGSACRLKFNPAGIVNVSN